MMGGTENTLSCKNMTCTLGAPVLCSFSLCYLFSLFCFIWFNQLCILLPMRPCHKGTRPLEPLPQHSSATTVWFCSSVNSSCNLLYSSAFISPKTSYWVFVSMLAGGQELQVIFKYVVHEVSFFM